MLRKILIICIFLFLSQSSYAYSTYLEQTIEIYNVRANCQLCHSGKHLNNFGNDFKKQIEISKDATKAIKAIEELDSDNDGFVNIDEIKAMSLPGDKLSIPSMLNKEKSQSR